MDHLLSSCSTKTRNSIKIISPSTHWRVNFIAVYLRIFNEYFKSQNSWNFKREETSFQTGSDIISNRKWCFKSLAVAIHTIVIRQNRTKRHLPHSPCDRYTTYTKDFRLAVGYFAYIFVVNLFGSYSGFHYAWSWTKLFAKVVSRQQKSPLAGEELKMRTIVRIMLPIRLSQNCPKIVSTEQLTCLCGLTVVRVDAILVSLKN